MKPKAFPLCWPEKQERTPASKQTEWQSNDPVIREVAYTELLKEVKRISGVTEIVVSSNLPVSGDGLNWGRAFAVSDKGVSVWFTRSGRELSIACDRFVSIEQNMRAITRIIDGRRREERYGTTSMIEQAWASFDTKELPMVKRVRPWPEVLGVYPNSPIEVAEATYRVLAKKHHPDTGGDVETFQELQNAIEEARKELQS